MWSTIRYASLSGPVVGVPLAHFVLFSRATFPYHLFLPKIYNFSSVLSNKVPQPLHLLLVDIVYGYGWEGFGPKL